LLEEGLETVFERHEAAARRCRERADAISGCRSILPRAVVADRDRTRGWRTRTSAPETLAAGHDIVLATGLLDLADDILRIGHMGHNARLERIDRTMDALEAVLE